MTRLHISKNLNQKNKESLPGTSFILSSNRSAGLIVNVCLRLAHRVWRNSSGVFGQRPLKGVEKDPGPNDSKRKYTKHQTQGKKNEGSRVPTKNLPRKKKNNNKITNINKTTTKNEHKNNKKQQTRDLPQLTEFLVMCIFQFLEQLTKASHGVRRIGRRQRYLELPKCKTSTILGALGKKHRTFGRGKNKWTEMILQVQLEGICCFSLVQRVFEMFLVEGVNPFEPRHGSYDLNVNHHKEKIEDLFAGPRELLNQDNQNE